MMARLRGFVVPAWLVASLALTPGPAQGQSPPPVPQAAAPPPAGGGEDAGAIRVTMGKRRPTVHFGSFAEVTLKGRLESTTRTPTPDAGRPTTDYAWRAQRLELEGTLFKRVEFELSRDFGDDDESERDAFVDVEIVRALQLRVGRSKLPFGRDALTGGANLDFVHRSLAGRRLAPGRDVGVTAHGRLFRRRISYEVGYFRRDGDNARTPQTKGARDATAARLVLAPFSSRRNSALQALEIGGAVVASHLDGQLGLRGRTVFGEGVFFDRVYVNGLRLRRGLEAGWTLGPASLAGEYIVVSDERSSMGSKGEALPPVRATGWYLAGTWVLTGERKEGRVDPRRSVLVGGPGAIEVSARVERLGFDAVTHPGSVFENPRPEGLASNAERVVTVGLAWYVQRYVKVLGNVVIEAVDDPRRSPAPRGNGRFPSGVVLLQFAL